RDDGAGGADLRVQGVAGDAVDHVTAVLGLHDAVHGVVTGGESSDAHTRQSRSSGSVRRSGLTAPAPPTGSTGDGARPPAGRRPTAPPAPVHGPSSPRGRSAGADDRGRSPAPGRTASRRARGDRWRGCRDTRRGSSAAPSGPPDRGNRPRSPAPTADGPAGRPPPRPGGRGSPPGSSRPSGRCRSGTARRWTGYDAAAPRGTSAGSPRGGR